MVPDVLVRLLLWLTHIVLLESLMVQRLQVLHASLGYEVLYLQPHLEFFHKVSVFWMDQ
jgi:hypothetical protein